MDRPVFKMFQSSEGLYEMLKSGFLALIMALRASAIEPSQAAMLMANRLKNNEEVSCCDLKREYRKMALELHPDKEGGTHEDMILLNDSRDSRTDCSSQKMRGCKKNEKKTREKLKEKPKERSKKSKEKSKQKSKEKSKEKPKERSKKSKQKSKEKSKEKPKERPKERPKKKNDINVEELVGGIVLGVGVGIAVRHLRKPSTDDEPVKPLKKYNMPLTPERTTKKKYLP